MPSVAVLLNTTTTPAAIEHTIGYITRRRKARHARLKELAKEEPTWLADNDWETEVACPVCSQPVHGDRDVVDAHVDACLAYENRRAYVEREHQPNGLVRGNEVDVDIDIGTGWDAEQEGSIRTRVIANASLRGTGILIRPSMMDTEDDIDVDGTDDAMFGEAQFGEADVFKVAESEAEVDGPEHVNQRSNHDRPEANPLDVGSRCLTSNEDMDKLDLAIMTARSRGDDLALVAALEAKLNAVVRPLPLVTATFCSYLCSLRQRLAASACRHMLTLRCPQGVGTHAAQHVG